MAIRNYLKVFADGHTEATKFRPLFQEGERERAYAGENPDVLVDGLWCPTSGGDELVTGGNFDSQADVDLWTSIDSSVLALENNSIKVTNGATAYGKAEITLDTEIGTRYRVSVDIIQGTDGEGAWRLGTTSKGSEYGYEGGSSIAKKYIEFTASTTTLYLALSNGGNTSGEYSYFDNISVFEAEIQPEAPYEEQFTYASQDDKLATFLIEDGQPVDITYDYDSPSIVHDVIQAGKVIWTDYESQMKFLQSDGIDYDDPDAIGANPVAKIYPDGTIVGSTDNGNYVKYPNGELEIKHTSSELLLTNSATVTVFNSPLQTHTFPITFVGDLPKVTPSAKPNLGGLWASMHSALYSLSAFSGQIHSASSTYNGYYQYIAKGKWKL